MRNYKIITDFVAPQKWRVKHPDVFFLPTTLVAEGREFDNLSPEGLEAVLKSSKTNFIKNQNISLLNDIILKTLKNGDHALCIMMSSYSENFQCADLLCNAITSHGNFPTTARAVNSHCVSIGTVLVIQRALEFDDIDDAISAIESYGNKIQHVIAATNVAQFQKGRFGRFLARILRVKPIFTVVSKGEAQTSHLSVLTLSEKAMINKLVQTVEKNIDTDRPLIVAYGAALSAESVVLTTELRRRYPNLIVLDGWRIDPVLGYHIGPSILGVFYVKNNFLGSTRTPYFYCAYARIILVSWYNKSMKIAILGAGAYGLALGEVASSNGHSVNYYDPYKLPNITMSAAVDNVDAIIYVAPSDQAPAVLPKLPKTTPLICASKGFLSVDQFNHFSDFSALGGAAFAENITTKTPCFGKKIVLTSSSPLAEKLFANDLIHVEYTPDTLGIILCGALKNVYAIGSGMYDKDQSEIEQSSDSTETALAPFVPFLTTAAEEVKQILAVNGANPNTVTLSCGIPDLLLSSDQDSRNFRFGRAIETKIRDGLKNVNTDDISGTIEGLFVIKSLPHYPNFNVPSSATLFNDIVSKVRQHI